MILKYIFALITYFLMFMEHERDNIKYFYAACVPMLACGITIIIEAVKELN